mgnify:CR=1 FL=1
MKKISVQQAPVAEGGPVSGRELTKDLGIPIATVGPNYVWPKFATTSFQPGLLRTEK